MLNNDYKNSDCQFTESLVEYLYGEIGAAEKNIFEVHLEICATCNDELGQIGFARTAVHEWRVVEFDNLPAPHFEIPTNSVETVQTDSPSWLANWRQIFAFKPALALSSLVILIAFFGIAAFVFNFRDAEQVAEKIDNKEPVKTIASPTVEKIVEPLPKIITGQNADKSEISVESLPTKSVDKKLIAEKNTPVKVSVNTSKNSAAKTVQNDADKTPRAKIAPKSDVPRLSEADDEEDDSVRLADLFDEIGTD